MRLIHNLKGLWILFNKMVTQNTVQPSSPNFFDKKFKVVLIVTAIIILGIIAYSRTEKNGITPATQLNGQKTLQTNKLVEEESVVIDVVEKVSPSVVSITIQNRQIIDPFGFRSREEGDSGIGTGFVVQEDGLIITNKHVVSETDANYSVIVPGEEEDRKLDVAEINRDPFNDLAILKVDANDLIPVELGDSDNLKVGQKVIAIGNALGRFQNTVTVGVVSGLGRGISVGDPFSGIAERFDDLIQTDAAINPGNSGGPLVNSAGQVIGINSAKASADNIGFALKVNIAKQLLDDFYSAGGKISRPFLGIRYSHISKNTDPVATE